MRNTLPASRLLISIVTLCMVYALVGRLALMLAIPPGYATAIFPSAGIAVAALLIWGNRLWPGVFLGSLCMNLWIGLEQAPFTDITLQMSLAAASGAALQALAGAWLVRRFVSSPIALDTEFEIFRFMLLAGPVSCLINASMGVSFLLYNGLISPSEFAFSWFTWWTGDTIGVLITTPLLFILFANPRKLWWSRRNSVALPLISMLVVVITLFIWVSKWEMELMQFNFKEAAIETSESLRTSFSGYVNAVASIERFFVSSKSVDREEFHNFVTNILRDKSGIQALGWNPVISDDQRSKFERARRNDGFAQFQITERNAQGEIINANVRDEYVVVDYIEPMQGNENAIGFDVASNPERRQALIAARDSGQAVASARVTLIQEKEQQAGFIFFHPVYKGPHSTVGERRQNLKGFAVGVFRIGDIINAARSKHQQEMIMLNVYDITSIDKPTHLYGAEDQLSNALYQWNDSLSIGGRDWGVRFTPSSGYLTDHRGWQAWAVLAFGLLFTSILGAFLLAMTGRSYLIEELVTRRTAELSGIVSSAIEAIITVDDHGRIETINPAGEKLLGYELVEIVNQPIHKLIPDFFKHPSTNNHRGASPELISNRRDTYATRKDKSEIFVELAISTITISNKILYTAIIHDLTERNKVNRMKDEFLSTVSHELRTPLTSIKGALGLIIGGTLGEIPANAKAMLDVAYNNSNRLNALINDLLDISKLESGKMTFSMTTLHINELITKAVTVNQGYADKYHITLQTSLEECDDILIVADENRLIQVISNLLSNAIKYSPESETVLISVSHDDFTVRVSISDKGKGIPNEFRERIFQRFSQVDSSDTRTLGGTGLGLAISKEIINGHHGEIGFSSETGKGSVFYFELPIYKE